MLRRLLFLAAACLPLSAPALGQAPAEGASPGLSEDSGVVVQSVCTNCNNADLTVGGLGNEYVPITCDGVPVPPGLGQVYLLSVMPQTLVDRVTVHRGAGEASLEGGAVGGGIEIRRHTPRDGWHVDFGADVGDFGWASQQLDARYKVGWFGATLAATHAVSDAVNANGDAPLGLENWELPEFDRTTYELRFDLRPSEDHVFRAGVSRYDEDQENGQGGYDDVNSERLGQHIYNLENVALERTAYDLSYDGRLPDGSHVEAGLLQADRGETILETQVRIVPFVETPGELGVTYIIDERHAGGHVAWSRLLGDDWRLGAGASRISRDSSVIDVARNILEGIPYDQAFTAPSLEWVDETGIWAEAEWSAGPSLDLTFGLRHVDVAYTDNEDRENWLAYPLPEGDKLLPRLAVSWKPSSAWTLRTTAGKGFRPPTPTYAEVCCGRRYRGNRGIPMESSTAYGLEATWQPSPELRLNATLSRTDFEQLVVKLATLTYGYRPTYQNASASHARLGNLSLEGRWDLSSWVTVRGSMSWLDAENRSEGDRIHAVIDFFNTTITERDYFSARIPYRAQRSGALGVDFRPSRRSTLSLSLQYTGPMLIQTFDEDNFIVEDGYFSSTQEGFVSTDDVFVSNVRFQQQLPKGLTLTLGVDNVGDTVQDDLGDPRYDYDWGPLRGRYVYGGIAWRFDR